MRASLLVPEKDLILDKSSINIDNLLEIDGWEYRMMILAPVFYFESIK